MVYTVSSKEQRELKYDSLRWKERTPVPVNTLQLFITNQCNLRCKGCFYAQNLGAEKISFEDYKKKVETYRHEVQKIILLGGEPTIHPELEKILQFNQEQELRTTIYTNGFNLKRLEDVDLRGISVRIGVYGSESSEKPLSKIEHTEIPVQIVYMLRRDNVGELAKVAKMAEDEFNCTGLYVSSIREIDRTGSFWEDTEDTIPIEEYATIVQDFVRDYSGGIKRLDFARRGVLFTKNTLPGSTKCRFGNLFPDKKKIICPFDISREITSPELIFNSRRCNKHFECILQKIVLERTC
jgi:MoaA/NifB/PqqE/SkfB family radical SAM enzyme